MPLWIFTHKNVTRLAPYITAVRSNHHKIETGKILHICGDIRTTPCSGHYQCTRCCKIQQEMPIPRPHTLCTETGWWNLSSELAAKEIARFLLCSTQSDFKNFFKKKAHYFKQRAGWCDIMVFVWGWRCRKSFFIPLPLQIHNYTLSHTMTLENWKYLQGYKDVVF